MGKYADALLGGTAPPEGLPPPVSDSSKAAGYGDTAAASYIADPMAQARYFAKRRGLPLERYRIVQDRPAYQADDGNWYYERPDLAPLQDPGSVASNVAALPGPIVANAPAVATGILTAPAALAGPGGLAASMGLTGLAGAAGSTARDAIGNAISGESQPGTAGRAGESAVFNALGQGIGAGINAFLGRNAVRDLPRLRPGQASALERQSLREGIPLTPAELTNLESLKATQRILTNMPSSAGIMRDFYEGRANSISSRVAGMLDAMSPQDSGEIAGRNLRDWALIALEGAKNERAAAAEPFYEAAKRSGAQVDPRPVLGFIDRELQTAKGATRNALLKARSYFFQPGTDQLDTSISGLHSAKLALDDLLNGLEPDAAMVGPGGSKSTSFATLARAKDGLTQLLRNASPDYAQGMDTFQAMSRPLDDMKNSLIGVLAKTSDANAQKAMLAMFDPAKSGPRAIAYARGVFGRMGPEGQQAWQDAKRAFLQDTWAKASREFATTGQNPSSLAGPKFRALLLGDQRQQDALRAALTPGEFDSLSNFGDVMEAIGRVRLTGSETAWNQDMIERSREGARPLVVRIARNLNPAQALRSFDATVTDWFQSNDLERMARVYTSPDAMRRLKELRALKPGTQRWTAGVTQLAAELGEDFVDSMLARTSDAVPPLPGRAQPQSADQTSTPSATRRRSYSQQLGLTP